MAFTYNRKVLKKPYQFLRYALAYLRKGRYAPACLAKQNGFGSYMWVTGK